MAVTMTGFHLGTTSLKETTACLSHLLEKLHSDLVNLQTQAGSSQEKGCILIVSIYVRPSKDKNYTLDVVGLHK